MPHSDIWLGNHSPSPWLFRYIYHIMLASRQSYRHVVSITRCFHLITAFMLRDDHTLCQYRYPHISYWLSNCSPTLWLSFANFFFITCSRHVDRTIMLFVNPSLTSHHHIRTAPCLRSMSISLSAFNHRLLSITPPYSLLVHVTVCSRLDYVLLIHLQSSINTLFLVGLN